MDRLTPQQRHYNMAAIHGNATGTGSRWKMEDGITFKVSLST